ncbi:hypothetical protein [Cupriavidus necator]
MDSPQRNRTLAGKNLNGMAGLREGAAREHLVSRVTPFLVNENYYHLALMRKGLRSKSRGMWSDCHMFAEGLVGAEVVARA